MQSNFRDFILSPPILYAWLLRADVRGDAPIDDVDAQKDFLVWWIVYGAREYGQKPALSEREKAMVFEPLSGKDSANHYCRNRFTHRLLRLIADDKRPFDFSDQRTLLITQAWVYIECLKKYELLDMVDEITLRQLDETPPFLRQADTALTIEPEVTWLMLFLWQLRPVLQRTFDLAIRSSQLEYIAWFFYAGLQEEGLYPLVSQRWKPWLNAVWNNSGIPTQLSRAALLLWQGRQNLHESFDINSPAGCTDFSAWVKKAKSTEPLLKWLAQSSNDKPIVSLAIKGNKKVTKSVRSKHKKSMVTKFGVNLIGCVFGELGIGEDVRMAAVACDAAGIPYSVINIPLGGGTLRQADRFLEDRVTANLGQLDYPISILCLPGFDSAIVRLYYGDVYFSGHYTIGWWPWELPDWPRNWASAFELIDEVWAATEFTLAMYQSATSLPITLMPLPVSVSRMQPIDRKALGLPIDKFLFLYVFDSNSYLARKNPWSVVEAFRRAFPAKDKSVGLVLKTMNAKPDNPLWQVFKRLCATDRRIILLDMTLDRPEVLGLMDACDAYVSLHRSEGFGRTMAEAILFCKPVVGTDYSGNRDFLTNKTGFPVKWNPVPVRIGEYPHVEEGEAVWAEPDMEHAAIQMQRAFMAAKDREFCARVRDSVKEQFSPERIGKLMRTRLESIYQQLMVDGEPPNELDDSANKGKRQKR